MNTPTLVEGRPDSPYYSNQLDAVTRDNGDGTFSLSIVTTNNMIFSFQKDVALVPNVAIGDSSTTISGLYDGTPDYIVVQPNNDKAIDLLRNNGGFRATPISGGLTINFLNASIALYTGAELQLLAYFYGK